jgi:hypothetical protein
MNKFTPGPWNATKFNPVTGDIDDMYLYVEPGIAVIERNVKGRDQHDTANARLIAAAPDLLDALEACRNELASMIDMHNAQDPDDGSWLYDHQTVCEADAAIARAKGESN